MEFRSLETADAIQPDEVCEVWIGPNPNNATRKRHLGGVPVVAQQTQIRLGTMRFRVRSLASLGGLRIWRCRELRCRSQPQLGSGVAVALV